MSRIFNTGEHTMKNTRLSRYFLIIGIVCPLVAAARIGETPDESQKRYGAATPAATDHVILANATNQVFTYMGWQITAAYVDAKTARIRYRKGRLVQEPVPQWVQNAKESGLLNERQVKKRAGKAAKLNHDNNRPNMTTISVFKEDPISADEVKTILKSESPIGNWREYDPKTQSRNAVFLFAAKEVPPSLINDYGLVAHVTPTCVTLEKPALLQEFEKQSGTSKDTAHAIPKF